MNITICRSLLPEETCHTELSESISLTRNLCLKWQTQLITINNNEHHWSNMIQAINVRSQPLPLTVPHDYTTLSSTVKTRWLCRFGHVAWLNEMAHANRILFAQPLDNWKRPQEGHAPLRLEMFGMTIDLSSFGMELPEAREATHNRPFWADVNEEYL